MHLFIPLLTGGPDAPGGPLEPGCPPTPFSPGIPGGPAGPWGPESPFGPLNPSAPGGPAVPAGPYIHKGVTSVNGRARIVSRFNVRYHQEVLSVLASPVVPLVPAMNRAFRQSCNRDSIRTVYYGM